MNDLPGGILERIARLAGLRATASLCCSSRTLARALRDLAARAAEVAPVLMDIRWARTGSFITFQGAWARGGLASELVEFHFNQDRVIARLVAVGRREQTVRLRAVVDAVDLLASMRRRCGWARIVLLETADIGCRGSRAYAQSVIEYAMRAQI